MEIGHVLRSARQQAGLSQRALASRAGVQPSRLAEIESGTLNPSWLLVTRLVEAAGRDLALALPQAGPTEALWAWLRLSTSQRLYRSLGGPAHLTMGRWPLFEALSDCAHARPVALSPEASLGVWLPGRTLTQRPLPISTPLAIDGLNRAWEPHELLDLTVGPVPLVGRVRVGVSHRNLVMVWPPDAPQLQLDAATSSSLRAVSTLLEAERRRDAAGRRPAAHGVVNTRQENDWVMSRRYFASVPAAAPSQLERRDWRLGGEASFREWLAKRGYPLRDRRFQI